MIKVLIKGEKTAEIIDIKHVMKDEIIIFLKG